MQKCRLNVYQCKIVVIIADNSAMLIINAVVNKA